MRRRAIMVLALLLLAAPPVSASDAAPQHVIYLHGRIIQAQQNPRPEHPEWGHYELAKILEAFRHRGFVVIGEIRPEAATVASSADHVVAQIRGLVADAVRPDHITVVGGSMGGGIALLASARLGEPKVRFAVLGTCLTESVRAISAQEGKAPSGYVLSIREASDVVTKNCAPWNSDIEALPSLRAQEIVIDTGLSHGFLYRPIPEWLEPVLAFASRPEYELAIQPPMPSVVPSPKSSATPFANIQRR